VPGHLARLAVVGAANINYVGNINVGQPNKNGQILHPKC